MKKSIGQRVREKLQRLFLLDTKCHDQLSNLRD